MTASARSALALTAAIFLGVALMPRAPGSQWFRVALLVPVILSGAWAALGTRVEQGLVTQKAYERVVEVAMWIGLIVFAWSLLQELDWLPHPILFAFGAVVCGGAAFAVSRSDGSRAFAVFIAAYLLVSLGVLAATRDELPNIDVALFQQDAPDALLRAENPYAMRFPDIYTPEQSAAFYGPGVSVNGELQFGYPYPPLSLIAIIPFEVLLGDFRIAHALALVATALVMSRIRPGPQSRRLAVLFLLVSPVFRVIRFGWIEPLLILAATLVVLGATRSLRATPYLAGVLLSLKQYSALLLPASLLLIERPWRLRSVVGFFARAGIVVLATVLPFFLWNPGEFTWSVIELQFEQPFRPDSLSFMALWAELFGQPPRLVTSVLPLVIVVAISAAILLRTPSGAQGFALAAALTLLVAFAFSKQAFSNYYILVIGLLFLGAAAGEEPAPDAASRLDGQIPEPV